MRNRLTVNSDAARFGQRDLPLAIDRALQTLGYASPKIEDERVAWAQHVIGSGRHIHRKLSGVPRAQAEDIAPEAFELGFGTGNLSIEVFERGQFGIRAAPVESRSLLRVPV